MPHNNVLSTDGKGFLQRIGPQYGVEWNTSITEIACPLSSFFSCALQILRVIDMARLLLASFFSDVVKLYQMGAFFATKYLNHCKLFQPFNKHQTGLRFKNFEVSLMTFYSFGPHIPEIEPDTFIAPGSFIIGQVYIAEGASIWYCCVLRGDVSRIKVGRKTNIQDGCILHGAALPIQLDVEVGDYVNIGHKAIIHGCKIGNNALIGMSTVILNGAQIGEGSIIGACSLVTQGKEIPPNVLAVGSPAKVIRPVTEEDRQWTKRVNEAYFQRGRYYSEFVKPVEVKPVDRG